MTGSHIDAHALATIERVLSDKPWLDPRWGGGSHRFATAMADVLVAGLATEPVAVAVASAYTDARAGAPMALPVYHETWARLTLALVVRELVREVSLEAAAAGEAQASELTRVAGELALAANALAPRDSAATVKLHALERVVCTARTAMVDMRDRTLIGHPGRGYVAACFNQLSHALTLFMTRDPAAESVVRDAALRADAAARRNGVRGWVAAPPAMRRALVRRSLAEAAGALVRAVPDASGASPETRDAGLWLARTATQILACLPRVDEWFPDDDESEKSSDPHATESPPGKMTTTTTTTAARKTTRTEAVMKDSKDATHTIVKTLQNDATDAAWRTAGSQFVKLTREPLVGLLSRHLAPGDESVRAKIAAFLETDIGTAMLSGLLSVALSAAPTTAGDVPQRLARELRVRAMSEAGDLAAELLMGPLREVMTLYLKDVQPIVATPAEPPALGEPAPAITASSPANVVAMAERGGNNGDGSSRG